MCEREVLLARIWSRVPAPGRPVLVAVDGPDGAGKTTFADALAEAAPERTVVRGSLDDFHHPQAHRHAEGRTGETYLDASDDVRVARMAERDGVSADAEHPDQRRYLDAQRIYLTGCRPREQADVVIDNTDPATPGIVRITPRRVTLGAE